MAIPSSGSISINDIATEFGGDVPHSLSEYYAGGGRVPSGTSGSPQGAVPSSGQIAIGRFYGTQNRPNITLTISSPAQNYDVWSNASANPSYSAGTSDIIVNVNPGVNVGTTSTGSYAMSVPASFNPGDTVTINNSGTIIGMGGNGGYGSCKNATPPPTGGGAGGNAVNIARPTTINNTGTLAGGGGGGGGGGTSVAGGGPEGGGGSGGGGAGYNGGAGGGRNPAFSPTTSWNGGSGTPGSVSAGGSGGGGGGAPGPYPGGPGGNGGGQGAGGGGGSPGSGPNSPPIGRYYGAGGGGAGKYLNGNPYVTWTSTGTRLGGVS